MMTDLRQWQQLSRMVVKSQHPRSNPSFNYIHNHVILEKLLNYSMSWPPHLSCGNNTFLTGLY